MCYTNSTRYNEAILLFIILCSIQFDSASHRHRSPIVLLGVGVGCDDDSVHRSHL